LVDFKELIKNKEIEDVLPEKQEIEETKSLNEKMMALNDIIDYISDLGIKYKNLEFIKNGVQIIFFTEKGAKSCQEELKIPNILKYYSVSYIGKILSIIKI